MVSAVAAPRSPPPEADANRHAFREVMESHCQHEQRRSLPHDTRSLRHGLVWKLTVQVR
jgi:hypothetical protein